MSYTNSVRILLATTFLAAPAAVGHAQDDACVDQCYAAEDACIDAACASADAADDCDAVCFTQTQSCLSACGDPSDAPDPTDDDAPDEEPEL